jgi:hypothetical protein
MKARREMALFSIPAAVLLMWFAVGKIQRFQRQRTCIHNLKVIAEVKQVLASDKKLKPGDTVSESDVSAHYVGSLACPSEGYYTINPVGSNPVCSVVGHELPMQTGDLTRSLHSTPR